MFPLFLDEGKKKKKQLTVLLLQWTRCFTQLFFDNLNYENSSRSFGSPPGRLPNGVLCKISRNVGLSARTLNAAPFSSKNKYDGFEYDLGQINSPPFAPIGRIN